MAQPRHQDQTGNATAYNNDVRCPLFVRFHGRHPTAKALSGSKADATCREGDRCVFIPILTRRPQLGGDHFSYAPLHLDLVGPRCTSSVTSMAAAIALPGRWRFPVVKMYGSSPP